MAGLEASHAETTFDDFMAYVKTDGYTNSTHWDCLGSIVNVIVGNTSSFFSDCAGKLQPVKVAQEAKPIVAKWSGIIAGLSTVTGDPEELAAFVICEAQGCVARISAVPGVPSGEAIRIHRACVVVGVLLALRDIDCIAEVLLEGCRGLQERSLAMNKFIEFLEGEEEEEDDFDVGEAEANDA